MIMKPQNDTPTTRPNPALDATDDGDSLFIVVATDLKTFDPDSGPLKNYKFLLVDAPCGHSAMWKIVRADSDGYVPIAAFNPTDVRRLLELFIATGFHAEGEPSNC
jgi:hypothetical protein